MTGVRVADRGVRDGAVGGMAVRDDGDARERAAVDQLDGEGDGPFEGVLGVVALGCTPGSLGQLFVEREAVHGSRCSFCRCRAGGALR